MPAIPVADCVTVGRLLTSLCLFLLICEMVLVVVCGHLPEFSGGVRVKSSVWGLASSSPKPVQGHICSIYHLLSCIWPEASGSSKGRTIYCSRLFPSRRPAWVARPLRSLPYFQKPTVRAAFTYPLPGCWICHLVWAYLFRAPILSLRILDLMRWEQFEGRDDFRMRIKLDARSND